MTVSCPEKSDLKENETKEAGHVFRETPLRYIGYMLPLGWVCRSLIPYHLTGMAAVTYVCSDAFVRSSAAASQGDPDKEILVTASDVFLWHFLASFAFPGIVMQGVSSATSQFQTFRSKCRPRSNFYLLPCFLSGLTLPLISRPIDRTVDELMNKFIRKSTAPECLMEVNDDEKCERDNLKFKWFYDQSKDLQALELERYNQKLKEDKERQRMQSRNLGQASPVRDALKSRDTPKDTDTPKSTAADIPKSTAADIPKSATIPKTSSQQSTTSDDAETQDGLRNKKIQVDKKSNPNRIPKTERTE